MSSDYPKLTPVQIISFKKSSLLCSQHCWWPGPIICLMFGHLQVQRWSDLGGIEIQNQHFRAQYQLRFRISVWNYIYDWMSWLNDLPNNSQLYIPIDKAVYHEDYILKTLLIVDIFKNAQNVLYSAAFINCDIGWFIKCWFLELSLPVCMQTYYENSMHCAHILPCIQHSVLVYHVTVMLKLLKENPHDPPYVI